MQVVKGPSTRARLQIQLDYQGPLGPFSAWTGLWKRLSFSRIGQDRKGQTGFDEQQVGMPVDELIGLLGYIRAPPEMAPRED